MAEHEGSWWSRAWCGVAVLAFAIHLGAAVYDAAVIAPLWSLSPPASVTAWAALKTKPDASQLFQALTALIAIATAMAWFTGISDKGWRRWWLTLALASAFALVVVSVALLAPSERALFGAAALSDRDGAQILSFTGDWIRGAALRIAALVVGAWASYRAQLAGGASRAAEYEAEEAPSRRRRARDFSFGDEPDEEMTLGEDAVNPRERWVSSLPRRRRTAKK